MLVKYIVVSGVQIWKDDWSTSPSTYALETYFKSLNKNKIIVGSSHEIGPFNIKITKIEEKSKNELRFSFSK